MAKTPCKIAQKNMLSEGTFTDLLCNLKIEYTMVPVQTPTQ